MVFRGVSIPAVVSVKVKPPLFMTFPLKRGISLVRNVTPEWWWRISSMVMMKGSSSSRSKVGGELIRASIDGIVRNASEIRGFVS